jgi:hypothetical protein
MSQWTHVSGLIRIDAIPSVDGTTITKVENRFGKTCTYDDDSATWDACTVPSGSEGSLQYEVKVTGEDSLRWGIVSVWGDLRDYEDYTAIYEWVKKSCKPFMIRSCMIKIDVEYKGTYIITDTFNRNTLVTNIKITEIPDDED